MVQRFIVLLTVVIVALATSPLLVSARASRQGTPSVTAAAGNSRIGASDSRIVPIATVAIPAPRDAAALLVDLQQLVAGSAATVGVTVVELGGTDQLAWSVDGDAVFTAASTYKLVALMMEAQNIAAGTTDPSGLVCYIPADYEAGWFDDYSPGACFTRNELASGAAKESDNTAGHMLVREIGGASALNAWAAAAGATNSAFFEGNTTTATDLATLWVAEAS